MGYGASSKGGGGSGSSGGGKKKSGRGGKKPKSRNFKVKEKANAVAATTPPPQPAFTVQEPIQSSVRDFWQLGGEEKNS